MVVVGLEVLVLVGGGRTPHDGSLGGTEGSERGKERWGQAKPTIAEEPPLSADLSPRCNNGHDNDTGGQNFRHAPPLTPPRAPPSLLLSALKSARRTAS